MAGRDFLHETRCLSCWQGPEAPPGKKKPKAKAKACAPCAPAKERLRAYLHYISRISPLHLPYISPISPHISPTSPLYLPISRAAQEREHLGADGGLRGCDFCPAAYHLSCIGMSQALYLPYISPISPLYLPIPPELHRHEPGRLALLRRLGVRASSP